MTYNVFIGTLNLTQSVTHLKRLFLMNVLDFHALPFFLMHTFFLSHLLQKIAMQVLGQVQISTRRVQPNCVIDKTLVCIHTKTKR